jgi:uncharacterized protein (TIGR03437 family)
MGAMGPQFLIRAAIVAILAVPAAAATPDWLQLANTISDAQGNTYAVGFVGTDIVPVTPGAFQTKFNGGTCGTEIFTTNGVQTGSEPIPCQHGFAAKISPGGMILYATYLEGSQNDQVWLGTVDSSGNLYILGSTTSPDFPISGSIAGFPPVTSGDRSFVLKLSPDGSHVLFCDTFGLPGAQWTTGVASLALGPDGKIFFAGTTDGTAFPTTPGAYLAARPNVTLDGFIFEWDPQANVVIYSTLLGGSGLDYVTGLGVDSSGAVYVTGYTGSTDFPVTPGAFFSPGTVEPPENVFVAKLDAGLSTLEISLLFGGSYHPLSSGFALDSSGNVYVAGWGSAGLPVTPGAYETSPSGGFLARFNGKTGARIYLTYLGDGLDGRPEYIVPATDGSAWVAGLNEYGGVVTTADAVEPSSPLYTGSNVQYLKHISADGSQQLYGTYLAELVSLTDPGLVLVSDSSGLLHVQDFNVSQPLPQPPLITSIVNAASMSQPSFIAPEEIVSIFGLSIGPDKAVSYKTDSLGSVSSILDGLEVLIDGSPAPILYASKNQINVVVPPSAAPPPLANGFSVFSLNATVQVRNPSNAPIPPASATKVPSLPGIFTSATGAGLILNQDATANGPDNPAMQGSIVSLFVTGLGPLTPEPPYRAVATVAPALALPIQVFLGSSPAGPYTQLDASSIQYAGNAPGEIEGIQQINVRLPASGVYSTLYIQAGAGVSNQVGLFEQ